MLDMPPKPPIVPPGFVRESLFFGGFSVIAVGINLWCAHNAAVKDNTAALVVAIGFSALCVLTFGRFVLLSVGVLRASLEQRRAWEAWADAQRDLQRAIDDEEKRRDEH